MAKDRNEQERRARFEKYYSQIDKDGSGALSYEEFKTFLTQYNKKEMPEKQNEFFFHGADADNGGTIDKEELWQLVEALHNNDKLYINKLFFRAVDKDKSREIDASEFVTMAELNNVEMNEEQAENQIKSLTGGSTKLTFAQMHKALTGEEIPADTDPYDGKLSSGGVKTRGAPTSGSLSEEEKNHIRSLITKYDKSGNGKLEFDEFIQFMSEGLQVADPKSTKFLNQMRLLYDGMDLDASHNLDQEEIITCMENFKTKNFKYLTRMIFRGADKNKNRKVNISELEEAVDGLGGQAFSKEEFDQRCVNEFGKKKKELEYWEFYKIITGETLDKNSPDYDPYEGKYKEKSKCCLLI